MTRRSARVCPRCNSHRDGYCSSGHLPSAAYADIWFMTGLGGGLAISSGPYDDCPRQVCTVPRAVSALNVPTPTGLTQQASAAMAQTPMPSIGPVPAHTTAVSANGSQRRETALRSLRISATGPTSGDSIPNIRVSHACAQPRTGRLFGREAHSSETERWRTRGQDWSSAPGIFGSCTGHTAAMSTSVL